MANKLRKQRMARQLALEVRLFNRKLGRRWKTYRIQYAMAALALLLVLLVIDLVLQAAIVVAIASTVFIVFVIPTGGCRHPAGSSAATWWPSSWARPSGR